MNTNHESVAYRSFSPWKFQARGARKVTTRIAGLWQPTKSMISAFGGRSMGAGGITKIIAPLSGRRERHGSVNVGVDELCNWARKEGKEQ